MEYKLSRLMLGTVQFGLPYGVANRTGQPSLGEVRAIVGAAIDGGVNCIDTAAAYGSSEAVLGQVLHELKAADRVVVVTKVRALTPEELADGKRAALAIRQSVDESRRRLRIDCLPLVLFHRESDGVYLDELLALKELGWLKHAGVSCDNRPGPAADFAAGGRAAALQIPCNLLDPRHVRAGSFHAAAAKGVAVFVRSVYLQGVLAMPEGDIPAKLNGLVPVRRRLEGVAREAGIPLTELAVRTMLAREGVTSVLTGVETVAQIRENLALFNRGPLPADLVAAVDAAVPELPEAWITPFMWPTLPT
jgi:aryl-alcohol dehydrogenase-like predicted oxidoreductase